jgi:hypothetical protein
MIRCCHASYFMPIFTLRRRHAMLSLMAFADFITPYASR